MYHIYIWLDDAISVPSITIPPPTTRQGPDGFSPNPDFVSSVEELFPDKSTKICVGCLSGKRSEAATAALEQAGYLSFE
jgi:rhodanese-related sulfurtransferase